MLPGIPGYTEPCAQQPGRNASACGQHKELPRLALFFSQYPTKRISYEQHTTTMSAASPTPAARKKRTSKGDLKPLAKTCSRCAQYLSDREYLMLCP